MKYCIILLVGCILLFSCQSNENEKNISTEEKAELEKVETFKKTDKQKEDSVLAKWQNKMNDSKVGD